MIVCYWLPISMILEWFDLNITVCYIYYGNEPLVQTFTLNKGDCISKWCFYETIFLTRLLLLIQHFQSLILSVSKRLKGRKFIFSTSRWFYSIFISLVNSIFVSWFQRMYLLKPFELWVFDWFKYFFSKDDFIIGFLFSNFILREHETLSPLLNFIFFQINSQSIFPYNLLNSYNFLEFKIALVF